MISRSEALQYFVNAATTAFGESAQDPEARRTVRQARSALKHLAPNGSRGGSRLPVCSHLQTALAVETNSKSLDRLIIQFKAVEPLLNWQRRATCDATTASDSFVEGHADAMIIGPGGIEDRRNVWLGVSLLAPHVRYPDHKHEPEEVYLAISEGEFRQEEGVWFSPGIGGSFYNRPFIKHAMRSLASPLFAFWLLRNDSRT